MSWFATNTFATESSTQPVKTAGKSGVVDSELETVARRSSKLQRFKIVPSRKESLIVLVYRNLQYPSDSWEQQPYSVPILRVRGLDEDVLTNVGEVGVVSNLEPEATLAERKSANGGDGHGGPRKRCDF